MIKMFKKKLKNMPFYVVLVVICIILSQFIGGLWSIIIFMVALTLQRAWTMRHIIIDIKHQIESVIWGKPLKYYNKEELKNTKIKFVWGNKKDESNKNK
jgi:hypothetical protein